MVLEREEHLKLLREQGQYDKANGAYIRDYHALSQNAMTIRIPRTRLGTCSPLILELIKYSEERVNELALLLYAKGMTSRDVSKVLEDFFGEKMSDATINK